MHYYTISAPLAAKGSSLPVVLLEDLVLDLLELAHLRKLPRVVVQVLDYQRLFGQSNGQLAHQLLRPPQWLKLRRFAACFKVVGPFGLRVEASGVGECEVVGLEGGVVVVGGEFGAVGCDCVVDVVEGGKGRRLRCAVVGVQSDQVSVGTVSCHAR